MDPLPPHWTHAPEQLFTAQQLRVIRQLSPIAGACGPLAVLSALHLQRFGLRPEPTFVRGYPAITPGADALQDPDLHVGSGGPDSGNVSAAHWVTQLTDPHSGEPYLLDTAHQQFDPGVSATLLYPVAALGQAPYAHWTIQASAKHWTDEELEAIGYLSRLPELKAAFYRYRPLFAPESA